MDEQMIEEMARAIWAANKQVGCSKGFHECASDGLENADPEVQDEFRHFARAAHSVMSARVAEQWQPIETAPHAMHVLAARFDEAFGEWIYGVVLSPPSNPFTCWRPLPAPPALAPHPKGTDQL